MKEMLKSKTMIIFAILFIGVTFISGYQAKLEDTQSTQEYVAYNMQ